MPGKTHTAGKAYTEEDAERVLEGISRGLSDRRALEAAGLSVSVWNRWILQDRWELAHRSAVASRLRADALADDVLTDVQMVPADVLVSDPRLLGLKLKTYQWVASAHNPSRYGSRQIHQTQEGDGQREALRVVVAPVKDLKK